MSSMSQNPCERRIAAMPASSNRSLRFRELRLAFPAALAILGGRESRVRDAEHSGAGNDSASCKYRASDDERLDAISIEAAESSTPAPNDIMAAMARCGSYAISPSIVPPSTPDAAANPQQKAHTAPVIPSDKHAPLRRHPRRCESSSKPLTSLRNYRIIRAPLRPSPALSVPLPAEKLPNQGCYGLGMSSSRK
jgi:hypothetical protein